VEQFAPTRVPTLFLTLAARLKSYPPAVIIFKFKLGCSRSFQRGTPVSEELNELIEMARTIRMTPGQAERQRRSFAYGNVKIENDSITWEMIDGAAEELEKEK
jgi:hypothetical protein